MTYWNLVERYGPDRFARDLSAAGGAGAITPDLTPDEAAEWNLGACSGRSMFRYAKDLTSSLNNVMSLSPKDRPRGSSLRPGRVEESGDKRGHRLVRVGRAWSRLRSSPGSVPSAVLNDQWNRGVAVLVAAVHAESPFRS